LYPMLHCLALSRKQGGNNPFSRKTNWSEHINHRQAIWMDTMTTLDKIEVHEFINELREDAERYLKDKHFDIGDVELKGDQFDELEYFIHNVGFYTTYFLVLCKQLEYGVKLFSNFKYDGKSNCKRIDHLRYNIENYIIRYHSLSDRLLQVINSVFHLTVDEDAVNYSVIMTNLKVARTSVPAKYRLFRKHIGRLNLERNIIVHRHSHLEKELHQLELIYQMGNPDVRMKSYRTKRLKDYVRKKTDEFTKDKADVFLTLPGLFDVLLVEYRKQRRKLKLITGR
jgi:hypothetical protein